ncbi:MAG: glycine--tRNA ligase subunit beta [Nitrospirota bacterium]|jgi:glycyl-tRNA synthetase beta chain
MPETLLLEIGTEELPARFIPGALQSLERTASEELKKNGIGFGPTEAFATPRRLALLVGGVPETQEGRVEEVFGPPRSAAFDAQGRPTKAALGFARSQGVEPESLVIRKKGKGEYAAAVIEEKGLPVGDVLPELLKKIILSVHFPKSMRWGHGSLRFARPIHWIVAMLGGSAVEFDLDGIRSGNRSRGHRFLSPGEFEVDEPDRYVELLRERFVVVDQRQRVSMVKEESARLCEPVSGKPYFADEDHPLIVADLVEYPRAVLGSFDRKYLDLPDELLGSVMWGHQKYFPVVDNYEDRNLMNHFIIVSNTREENAGTVRRGAERVIRARFEDARFYFEDDKGRTLESRVEDLRKVTFHERLGSLYEKSMRTKALASRICEIVAPGLKETVERAAALSKTDLVTGVVYEFPELQGVMGRYYAVHDGEKPEVASALHEQYLPAFAGDRLPESDTGAVVGLADRMDNIAAFFSVDLKPTGSEDPFALRRQALAVMTVLMEKGYPLAVADLLGMALEGLGGLRGPEAVEEELLQFFELRLEGLFSSRGHSQDLIQAVKGFFVDEPLANLIRRIEALGEFKCRAGYDDFLTAVKRVRNIIPGEELPGVDTTLFEAEEEKALFKALELVRSVKMIEVMLGEARVADALDLLLGLTAPVNDFFDKVLVMHKDPKVKGNRLSLLSEIWGTVSSVADFSKLAESGT